jgi:hypothetical protein
MNFAKPDNRYVKCGIGAERLGGSPLLPSCLICSLFIRQKRFDPRFPAPFPP